MQIKRRIRSVRVQTKNMYFTFEYPTDKPSVPSTILSLNKFAYLTFPSEFDHCKKIEYI